MLRTFILVTKYFQRSKFWIYQIMMFKLRGKTFMLKLEKQSITAHQYYTQEDDYKTHSVYSCQHEFANWLMYYNNGL